MRIWSFRGIYGNRGNGMEQATSDEAKVCAVVYGGQPSERRVRLMGNERRMRVLRFLVCFILIFLILMYISPGAS